MNKIQTDLEFRLEFFQQNLWFSQTEVADLKCGTLLKRGNLSILNRELCAKNSILIKKTFLDRISDGKSIFNWKIL